MATHFVAALDIPALQKTKQKIHTPSHNEYDEEFDVETSTEVEASSEDMAALRAAMIMDFTAVLGMWSASLWLSLCSSAFVARTRMTI